jgi:hypothetical protein
MVYEVTDAEISHSSPPPLGKMSDPKSVFADMKLESVPKSFQPVRYVAKGQHKEVVMAKLMDTRFAVALGDMHDPLQRERVNPKFKDIAYEVGAAIARSSGSLQTKAMVTSSKIGHSGCTSFEQEISLGYSLGGGKVLHLVGSKGIKLHGMFNKMSHGLTYVFQEGDDDISHENDSSLLLACLMCPGSFALCGMGRAISQQNVFRALVWGGQGMVFYVGALHPNSEHSLSVQGTARRPGEREADFMERTMHAVVRETVNLDGQTEEDYTNRSLKALQEFTTRYVPSNLIDQFRLPTTDDFGRHLDCRPLTVATLSRGSDQQYKDARFDEVCATQEAEDLPFDTFHATDLSESVRHYASSFVGRIQSNTIRRELVEAVPLPESKAYHVVTLNMGGRFENVFEFYSSDDLWHRHFDKMMRAFDETIDPELASKLVGKIRTHNPKLAQSLPEDFHHMTYHQIYNLKDAKDDHIFKYKGDRKFFRPNPIKFNLTPELMSWDQAAQSSSGFQMHEYISLWERTFNGKGGESLPEDIRTKARDENVDLLFFDAVCALAIQSSFRSTEQFETFKSSFPHVAMNSQAKEKKVRALLQRLCYMVPRVVSLQEAFDRHNLNLLDIIHSELSHSLVGHPRLVYCTVSNPDAEIVVAYLRKRQKGLNVHLDVPSAVVENSTTARIPLVDGLAQTYEIFHYSLPEEIQVAMPSFFRRSVFLSFVSPFLPFVSHLYTCPPVKNLSVLPASLSFVRFFAPRSPPPVSLM